MNTMYEFDPLPHALDEHSYDAGRRCHVAQYVVDPRALDTFNHLRATLDPRIPPLAPDQLATAARSLTPATGRAAPDCVAQRLRRALLAVRASRDRAWHAPEPMAAALDRVLDYLCATDDLIPDSLPTIGRLDDALIVDAAWPLLHDEVTAYEDFRRMRAVLREVDPKRAANFDRAAWLDLRRSIAAADSHFRHIRDSSYVQPSSGGFRVH